MDLYNIYFSASDMLGGILGGSSQLDETINSSVEAYTGINFAAMTKEAAFKTALSGILTIAVCMIAMVLIRKLSLKALGSSKKLDNTLRGFIYNAIKIVLWLVAAVIVADSLGIKTTSIVALFSIAGLALSLSIQNTMSNLFSGITLLIAKPFSDGDLVDYGGQVGTVKKVGLFYTQIDTADNIIISIPNSKVTENAIRNLSGEPTRRVDMFFEASYDDATEDVKNAILEAAAMDENILSDPAPFVSIMQYKDSSIQYAVRVWVKPADYWNVYFGMNEHVRECFASNGIQMTYNHINVHMMKDGR